MAEAAISITLPSFVFQICGNPERNFMVLDSFIETADFLQIITKFSTGKGFLNLVLQISRNAKSKFVIFYGFLVFTPTPKSIAKTTIQLSFNSLIFDKFLQFLRRMKQFRRLFCKFTIFCFAEVVFHWQVS